MLALGIVTVILVAGALWLLYDLISSHRAIDPEVHPEQTEEEVAEHVRPLGNVTVLREDDDDD